MTELGLEPTKSGPKAYNFNHQMTVSHLVHSLMDFMFNYFLHHRFGGTETQRDRALIPSCFTMDHPFTSLIITLGHTKISHCNGWSIMWFDQQKHWYTKEETGADFCISIYFRCVLLLFNNKGEETELEHSSALRITRAWKTKWVLISSNCISTLPVDICAMGLETIIHG